MSWAYVAATVATIAVGFDQKDQARGAQLSSEAQAKDAAADAQRAAAKANAKSPDVMALMASNMLAAKAGAGSTMLTGAGGLGTDQLKLGRTSLLGG